MPTNQRISVSYVFVFFWMRFRLRWLRWLGWLGWLCWLCWLCWFHLFFLPLLRSPLHQLPLGPSVFLGLVLVLVVFLGPIVLVLVPVVLVLVPIVLIGLGFLGLGLVLIGLVLVLIGLVVIGLVVIGLVLGWGSSPPPNTAIWSVYCVSGNSNTQKNVSSTFIYCYSLYIYVTLFLYGDKLININSNCELRLICFKITLPTGIEPVTSSLTATRSRPTELEKQMCVRDFSVHHTLCLYYFYLSFDAIKPIMQIMQIIIKCNSLYYLYAPSRVRTCAS